MKNIKKIILILIVLVIIAGIIMICLKGFNYSLLYSKTQRINIYMEKDFELTDIEEIAKEVFGENAVKVQLSNSFETVVSIVAYEITDDQKSSLIEKIDEKYEMEIDTDNDVIVTNIPQINIWDTIEKYVKPLLVVTLIILIFFVLRFRNQGLVNTLLYPVLSLLLINAFYVSIIALCRIPINEFFVIVAVLIYALTLIGNTIVLGKAEK